jgi:hypothetical protein
LANCQIVSPCRPSFCFKKTGSAAASWPIVRMPMSRSLSSVARPTKNSSPAGSGQSLSGSSGGKSVCTLSGFSKSPAILASSLLQEMPMFTVKPSSSRMRFLSRSAASTGGPQRDSVPVMSAQASSIENCSTAGETVLSSAIRLREAAV